MSEVVFQNEIITQLFRVHTVINTVGSLNYVYQYVSTVHASNAIRSANKVKQKNINSDYRYWIERSSFSIYIFNCLEPTRSLAQAFVGDILFGRSFSKYTA